MIVNQRVLVLCSRCRRYLGVDMKKTFSTQASHFRLNQRNYYYVLGVEKTASQTEIKAAYFELSKLHHPDRNPISSDQFLEIGKAYEILGKPFSRKDYDSKMYTSAGAYKTNVRYRTTAADPFGMEKDADSDDFDWYKRWIYDQEKWKSGQSSRPIYGIKGIPKLPDLKIVYYLILFALIGGTLQLLFVFAISAYRRKKFDAKSAEISLVLQDLERKVMLNKMKKQGLVTNSLMDQDQAVKKPRSEGVDDVDSTASKFRYTYHAKGTS